MRRMLTALSGVVLTLCSNLPGQVQASTSDPMAIALANKSVAAMTGGTPVADLMLSGTVTWIAGSTKQTGTAILMAKNTLKSRVDLTLNSRKRTVIRNDSGDFPQGAVASADGALQPTATHNCWVSPTTFFPPLSYLSSTSDPELVFSYAGRENRGDAQVEHIRVSRSLTHQRNSIIVSQIQELSTTDFYLDSISLLPVAMAFTTHPEDDAGLDIAVEMDFSSYKAINGLLVPMHIQKLVFNNLSLDLVVGDVFVNTEMSDDYFVSQ